MPDNKNQRIERNGGNEAPKKRSFFGGSLNANSKDFLDFRYNTQEEIDKFNEEMTTTDDLDEIMKQSNNMEYEDFQEKEEDKAEIDLNENSDDDSSHLEEKPIEGEVLENMDDEDVNEEENNQNINNEDNSFEDIVESNIAEDIEDKSNEDTGNIVQEIVENNKDFQENTEESQEENKDIEEKVENSNDKDENTVESGDNARFFDPFELDFPEDPEEPIEDNGETEEINGGDTEMFDPFKLDEESENNYKEDTNEEQIEDTNEEQIEDTDEEQIEDTDEEQIEDDSEEEVEDTDEGQIENTNEEQIEDTSEEEVEDTDEEQIEDTNEEQIEDDSEINPVGYINTNKTENEEDSTEGTNKKPRKYSAKGEEITDEEIQLEQGQDMADNENDEHNPSAEEIFEQEPEFFAADELSQQFMQLVQNVRGIFKFERKDGEQNPYFKILGSKTTNSTLEYLFYLIEEENEPIDLYIKKIETNQENGEENEHLLQFSYNKDQELNIFVDEVILYEKINKLDPDSKEWIDTKSVIEKFIFLTQTYYDKLEQQWEKEREEKQKKRQLQQIFKGF